MNAPVPVFPVRSCPVGVRGGRLCLVRIPALGCSSRRRPSTGVDFAFLARLLVSEGAMVRGPLSQLVRPNTSPIDRSTTRCGLTRRLRPFATVRLRRIRLTLRSDSIPTVSAPILALSRHHRVSPARGAQTLSGAERAVVEAHCFRPHLPLHEATESGSRSTNVVRHRESTSRSPLFPPPSSSSRVQLEEHKRCTAPKLKHFGSRHRYGCRKAVRGGAKA
ncbi:hypothetical protein B296_00014092 [Ensete ventricosum]|uniref:Uncharacterized protein n=1 Tax=Ensete ventricosum TaxID=4639 RepID=A0A427B731_ENSVE|nr:hypothetical protein B296_00014092 [Ensete ventricosum]